MVGSRGVGRADARGECRGGPPGPRRALQKAGQGIRAAQTSTLSGLDGGAGHPSLPARVLASGADQARGRPCRDRRRGGGRRARSPHPPAPPGGRGGINVPAGRACAPLGSPRRRPRRGRMLLGGGARAGRGLRWGWTALCLLSLLREYREGAPAGPGAGDTHAAAGASPGRGRGSAGPASGARGSGGRWLGLEEAPRRCPGAGVARGAERTAAARTWRGAEEAGKFGGC